MNRFFLHSTHYSLKNGLIHDMQNKIFKYELSNTKSDFIIKIQYKKIDDLFVLYHSEVPIEHKGHNLGHFIAKEVFDYLIEHNIKTAIYCPFLRKCVKEYANPKLKDIIERLPAIDKSTFEHSNEPW